MAMKLGIDYGTTTTLVSYTATIRSKSTSRIIDLGGNRKGYLRSSLPSLIAVSKRGDISIGYEAEKAVESNPYEAASLRSLKRCLACTLGEGQQRNGCWNQMNLHYCKGGQRFQIFNKDYSVRGL